MSDTRDFLLAAEMAEMLRAEVGADAEEKFWDTWFSMTCSLRAAPEGRNVVSVLPFYVVSIPSSALRDVFTRFWVCGPSSLKPGEHAWLCTSRIRVCPPMIPECLLMIQTLSRSR